MREPLEAFTEYFVRNYPGPDTVIFDPKWHAPKIFNAAKAALNSKDLTEERDRLREALKAIIREDDTGPMAYELREDGPSRAIGGTEGRFAAIARAALSPPTAEGREP